MEMVYLISIFLFPISLFLIIPALNNATEIRTDILDPVSYTIELEDGVKSKEGLFRKSSKGNIVPLQNEKSPLARRFIRGVLILDNVALQKIKKLSFMIKDTKVEFSLEEIKSIWIKENYFGTNYLSMPLKVSNQSVFNNLFFFSNHLSQVVNWSPKGLVVLLSPIFAVLILILTLIFHFKFFKSLKSFEVVEDKVWSPKSNLIVTFFMTLLGIGTYHFSRMEVDVHHTGFIFYSAQKFSQGYTLFKDIFFHYGPLTALIHKSSLLLFGERIMSLNLVTSIFYIGICASFLAILREFFSRGKALGLFFVWIVFVPFLKDTFLPWSSIYCLFFVLTCALSTIKFIKTSNLKCLFLSGVLASLSLWSRQSVGPLVMFAHVLYLILDVFLRKGFSIFIKQVFTFFFGVLIASIPFLIWLNLNNSFEDWVFQNFKAQGEWAFGGPIYKSKVWRNIISILFPFNFWGILPWVNLFVFLKLFTMYLKREVSTESKKLIFLVILSLGCWAQYFPVPCNRHYFWAGTPMFVAFFVYLQQAFNCLKNYKNFNLYLGSLILMMIVAIGFSEVKDRIISGIKKINIYKYNLKSPTVLSGMLVKDSDTVEQFEKINKYLEKYKLRRPESVLVSLEMYNQLYMTFLSEGKPFSILPSSVFTYGELESKYKYFDSAEDFIIKNRPILFSEKPIVREGYEEYFSYRFRTNIEYQAGVGYFYIPEE